MPYSLGWLKKEKIMYPNFKKMIIYIILFSSLIINPFKLEAIDYRKGVSFGINSTWFVYNDTPDLWPGLWQEEKNRILLSGSIFFEYSPFSKIFFCPSFRFIQLGNKINFDYENNPILVEKGFQITLTYLTLFLKIDYEVLSKPNFYFIIGPEMGYLLKSSVKTTYIDDTERKESITNALNRFHFSGAIGIGSEIFDFNDDKIFVEFLYFHGINNVGKESDWATNWKTREINLSAGIKF